MSGIFDRPADLPRVACSHCGGAHRAEAIPIDTGEPFPGYIAGTIMCPYLRYGVQPPGPITKSHCP